MRNNSAQKIALGGVLAALAMIIMCLGGLIPVATYVCPMLCALLGSVVLNICGKRIAWAWYVVVSILSSVLGPDKEAAAVYIFLGYYPLLKPCFDAKPLSLIWKLLYFNSVTALMYAVLLYLLGIEQLMQEYLEAGIIGLAVMLFGGNVIFFLLDKLFDCINRRKYG